MLITIESLFQYLKQPDCEALDISVTEKLKHLIKLLLIGFGASFLLGILISVIAQLGLFEVDSHAITKLLKEKSKLMVFFLAVVAAPVIEELFFRAPIVLFCGHKHFKYIFYSFAIIFGGIHLSNYDISTTILILAPILIAPQIVLGLILGYTRIKLGLLYSILFHMLFNGFLVTPSLLFMV